MKTVQELEQELELAREQEKQKEIDNTLEKMKANCGKYYATHQLNRYFTNKPAFNFEVISIIEPVYDKDRYNKFMYNCEKISIQYRKEKSINTEYTTGLFNPFDGFSHFRHEITKEQFETVKQEYTVGFMNTIDTIRNRFKANDLVSGGDYSDDSTKSKWLDDMGCKFIDMRKMMDNSNTNITVFETLRWKNHPFIYNERLYLLPGWDVIIYNIIREMTENAHSWGGSIADRDLPRARNLQKFIEAYEKQT